MHQRREREDTEEGQGPRNETSRLCSISFSKGTSQCRILYNEITKSNLIFINNYNYNYNNMPQAIIFLDDIENKKVEAYADKHNLSKQEAIKQMIREALE